MPFEYNAADCLDDLLDSAERIERYLARMDRSALERDELTWDAVERCLERICEAVFRLDDRAESLMPRHPWHNIRGMGNRLRHAYDRVDLDVVWNSARHDVPPLAADAARALRALEGGATGEDLAGQS